MVLYCVRSALMQSVQKSHLAFVFDDLMLSEACECFARSKTFIFEETGVDSAPFKQKEKRESSIIQLLFFFHHILLRNYFWYLVDAFIPSDFQSKPSQFMCSLQLQH